MCIDGFENMIIKDTNRNSAFNGVLELLNSKKNDKETRTVTNDLKKHLIEIKIFQNLFFLSPNSIVFTIVLIWKYCEIHN